MVAGGVRGLTWECVSLRISCFCVVSGGSLSFNSTNKRNNEIMSVYKKRLDVDQECLL